MGSRDRPDRKDTRDYQEPQEYQESRVDPDRTAPLDVLEHLVLRVNQGVVCPGPRALRGPKEGQVSQERRVLSACLASQGEKVQQVPPVLRESKVVPAPRALTVLSGPLGLQEQENQEALDPWDRPENQDPLVGKV